MRVTQTVVLVVMALTRLRAESTSSTLGSWWQRRLLFIERRLGGQSLVISNAPCSCIIR